MVNKNPANNNQYEVGFGSSVNASKQKIEAIAGKNGNYFEVFDDFLLQGAPEAHGHWVGIRGTDDVAKEPVVSATEVSGGAVALVSGDDDMTPAKDGSELVGSIPVQSNYGGLFMEARVKLSAITTVTANIGFIDNKATLEEAFQNASDTVTATSADAACFSFDTSATTTEWFACAVDSTTVDTDTATTGIAPAAGVYQVLRIEVSSGGDSVYFYIDGVLYNTLDVSGISPATDLYPYLFVNGSASRTLTVDYVHYGHNRIG